ncbi:MAG: hypothetical protein ABIW79_06030, partial [Gemmatimonas sp.]
MGRHAPGGDQARDVLAVGLTPHALRGARSEALQERLLVERLLDAIDAPPAERDVEGSSLVDG